MKITTRLPRGPVVPGSPASVARAALVAGLAIGVAAAPGPAAAAGPMFCGKREQIIADLARKYGETRRSYGLARNQGVIEVYASESGSWTILIARPGGIACLMAAGEAFEAEEATLPKRPI
ncbi:MAG: hypothetical protein AAF371_20185 [Pseudomonadota bacterium]